MPRSTVHLNSSLYSLVLVGQDVLYSCEYMMVNTRFQSIGDVEALTRWLHLCLTTPFAGARP